MYERILVPLDGSKNAESVLPNVERLARDAGSKVFLLIVETDPAAVATPNTGGTAAGETQTMEEIAAEPGIYLTKVARGLTEKGISVENIVASGNPAEEILNHASIHGCDLIAMCTSGRSGLKRGLMGSVTDAVVRASEIPVMVIGPYGVDGKVLDTGIKRIAVPLDGSPLAEEVLPHVERLARQLSLEVVLLRVVRLVPWAYGGHEMVAIDVTEMERSLELEASEYLAPVAESLNAKGIKTTYEVLHGIPWDKINSFVTEGEDMMVAISTHGRSGIRRLVLGSVADMVVRSLDTPVLIVRPY